jgi:putative phosphoesterase
MRIAVVSDIHGNLTALDAVIADLKHVSPDLIVHGGDLLGSGARQAEVVDRIRGLNWPGVQGNADEMLWNPDRAAEHLRAPAFQRLREIVSRHIAATVDAIGDERLDWLRALPVRWSGNGLTVVHAGPDDVWRSPTADASDEELVNTYGPLGSRRVVYGHIHRAYVRRLPSFTLANSGSVSLSYDGDPRSAYALVDDDQIAIRRVEYDIEREVTALVEMQYPYAAWIADMLRKGAYVPPPD